VSSKTHNEVPEGLLAVAGPEGLLAISGPEGLLAVSGPEGLLDFAKNYTLTTNHYHYG